MKSDQDHLDDYAQLRDVLVGLIGEGTVILDQHGHDNPSWREAARVLLAKQRKLTSQQFTIALLAEMQSGKSTLFNSIACEGREFSPVGSFIRTSGCPAYASDLGDPTANEYAKIEWRSDEELLAGFDTLLAQHFENLPGQRFKARKLPDGSVVIPSVSQELKLSDPADRELLRLAAMAERKKWESDKANYDLANLDITLFALLVAEFYQHPELRNARQASEGEFSPEAASSFIRYPKDWKARRRDGNVRAFAWSEVTFAFVRHVHFFLQAPRLAGIGCTLADCPGLSASRSDEDIAKATRRAADAILYLVSGEKELKQNELEVLEAICTDKMQGKLFFAWNIKTTGAEASDLLGKLKETLSQKGFTTATGDYFLIHASLALRADQACQVLDGDLDTHTKRAIATRLKIPQDTVPNRIWEDIEKYRHDVAGGPSASNSASRATVEAARQLGQVDTFVTKAKSFALRRGTLSILVENGAEEVVKALGKIEADLREREALAGLQLAQYENLVAQAESALRGFETEAMETLGQLDEIGPDYQLADEFVARLDSGVRQKIAREIAERLDRDVLKWGQMCEHVVEKWGGKVADLFNWRQAPSKTSLEFAADEACAHAFARNLGAVFNRWQADIEEDKHPIVNREIRVRVRRINEDLKASWIRHAPAEHSLLKGLEPLRVSDQFKEAVENARIKSGTGVAGSELTKVGVSVGLAAGGTLATVVALAAGKSAVTFLGFTLFTTTQPWMWPVIVVAAGAAVLGLGKLWQDSNDRVGRLQAEIDGELINHWGKLEEGLRPEIRHISAGIRKFYHQQFLNHVIPGPRAQFAERKAQADRDFQLSQQHRAAVSAKAEQIRTGQLQPVLRRLEQFAAECRQRLPQPG